MTLRILACVPIYNNENTAENVVASLLQETTMSVLVVDDGSVRPFVCTRPETQAAQTAGRIHVIRHEKNFGKGQALRNALNWAVKNGFTHLHALDGDGQHLATESVRLCAAATENPWDLIIGRRKFSGDNVPSISRFGRVFSNFWVGFQTGMQVHDSQSGFRVYPLFHVQNMRFWTQRFDFEIEVLIRLLWRGVHVTEVETDVFYPPEHERVSHFNKFTDNVRISILNTILVALSLILKNRQPKRSALAVFCGVFIGCTPFFGFHTLLVGLASFLFRLNAVLMFAGSQISFPPVALILVPLEITVGNAILGRFGKAEHITVHSHRSLAHVLSFAADHFWAWLVGGVALGLLLGLVAGLITWLIARGIEAKGSTNWTGKNRGGRFGNGLLKMIIRTFGLRVGYTCLYFVVPYFYLFAPKARAGGDEYWRIQRPEAGRFRRRLLILRQMFRFGQVLMDRASQNLSVSTRFQPVPHGIERISGPINQRQRLMLLSGHIGSWDLAASLLAKHQLTVVQYQSEATAMGIKQSLERGEPVALMADRATATQYELVSFLGRLAPFDSRPFRMAASLESAVVFTFALKGTGNAYNFYALPAIHLRYQTDRPRYVQLLDWIQDYAKCLEESLRPCPDQWFNFFPFFSAVPKSPPGVPPTREQHHLLEAWQRPTTRAIALEPVR